VCPWNSNVVRLYPYQMSLRTTGAAFPEAVETAATSAATVVMNAFFMAGLYQKPAAHAKAEGGSNRRLRDFHEYFYAEIVFVPNWMW